MTNTDAIELIRDLEQRKSSAETKALRLQWSLNRIAVIINSSDTMTNKLALIKSELADAGAGAGVFCVNCGKSMSDAHYCDECWRIEQRKSLERDALMLFSRRLLEVPIAETH